MTFDIIRGDALALPLADASVDLVVTSPPYFGLRSYQDVCGSCGGAGEFATGVGGLPHVCQDCGGTGRGHYSGQLGSEATPAKFVDALLAATAEMVRVLKPSGSIFVNLGDKYVADNRGSGADAKRGDAKWAPAGPAGYPTGGMRQKSLMGIPWRYALRCIDDLGLILRAEIIWAKPNGLPESVTDRVRRSHEQWFHFTVRPRYYSAVDEIRETYAPDTAARYATGYHFGSNTRAMTGQHNNAAHRSMGAGEDNGPTSTNPLGKLSGSVWSVPTQPLTVPAHLGVDHFAAFPMEWPRRIIRGWSPPGVCSGCGEGRRPVAAHAPWWAEYKAANGLGDYMEGRREVQDQGARLAQTAVAIPSGGKHVITGYTCACPDTTAPTTPAIVLDPFGGTGTTALVAHALGRHGISVDMSADYCRLAEWRCNDRGQLAAAMQVDRPDPVAEDQLDLFGGVA